MSLIFELGLDDEPERADQVRAYRQELDCRLKEFESPYKPPYSHDLAYFQRLSPLVKWNAYYSGNSHNLITHQLCLVNWCVLPGTDPEPVAWDVLMQLCRRTGEDLWRADVPGLEEREWSRFAVPNCPLHVIEDAQSEEDEEVDFHGVFEKMNHE
ncbi:hypothetical protein [Pseudodesulfovibrio methanolicus]|uniref:Uncharacterized protein n=1 Tax=Pseudodesulfovibrio methanolicus TaxID=3126690 RepID=A0ABZ2ISK1_9BACT